jgi:3-hydroxyanthranilate 3,4-dioxygenase
MAIKAPFNLFKWIEENRSLLKPPVGNKNLYVDAGDYIVMIVGGPNARKDYHYNETEELFFQLEGDILVKTQQNGKCVDVPIKAGEMFLLPAKIPHSPIRTANSIGLVIERKREPQHKDGLMWFSDKENALLYEEYFHLTNIEKDFLPIFKKFYADEKLRTCPISGEIMEVDPRFSDKD